ncbi:FAD dependent oxidoreductase [Novosphingobium nitrogenifigens DSM 19370]|uniref:FAD dependent oxidoreductase n=1 Tax=Novosphingobium nitrogenifigens DSM 19370 TaxID=983920 RepID=F1Z7T8_9SPHN|nr:FAD-binding oxidoreductase [Novosphingobium nitrogenifigens]EGD59287.1 FAD dependent oxidoreductase [Novosphingobium nitrogenifigens DSM 19370]
MTTRHFPDRAGPSGEDTRRHPASYYAATLDTDIAAPRLEQDTTADVCVIGGGFTGLGAALALARAGKSVRLVEAGPIGWGASGRNGGQVHLGWNKDQQWLAERLGEPAARRLWDVALAARAFLDTLIDSDPDRCDFRAGHIHADHKARYVALTHEHVRFMREAYGHEALTPLSRDAMRAMVDSPAYHGGSLDMAGGHLHPLKLVRAMARLAVAAGARLHGHSPARSITPTPDGWAVATPLGTIRAGQVLVAGGGYAKGLLGEIDARVLPINNYIATTEPLDPVLAARLIAGGHSVSDSRFVVHYFRVTPDHRLLFGGGETYGYRFPRDIAGFVRPHLERIYPQLAGVPLAHAWGGTLAITPYRLPCAREVRPGLWSLSGYSGLGVVLAPFLGAALGEAMSGRGNAAFDCLRLLPAPRFPGGRWLRWPTLVAAMSFFALRDRI